MSPYAMAEGWAVGDIRDLPHDTIPAKWLECLGQSLLRADYAALFAVIGTKWGSADGTHFNLPDLRRRVIVGRDDTAPGGGCNDMRAVAAGAGEEYHALVEAELAAHTHTVSGGPFVKTLQAMACCYTCCMTGSNQPASPTPATTGSPSNASTGSGTAHNNLQPYKVVRKIIKVTA